MKTEGGLVVNVYEDLEADFKTPSGNSASLSISGNYPFSGLVRLRILLRTPEEFRILFRIPEWGNTVLKIGEDVRTCVPGTYSEISRVWNADDKVELEFDLAPRTVVSPDISRIAYCSGPLVLAQDSRLSEVDQSVRENARAERISPPEGIHAAWRLDDGTKLCCYADAGNEFSRENPFTVWFRKTKN